MFLPCDKAPRLPSFKTKVAQSVLDQDKIAQRVSWFNMFVFRSRSSSSHGGWPWHPWPWAYGVAMVMVDVDEDEDD
eukprot:scaffold6500_cov76-Skeletonema_dohrnii-CCMP3373.AAC.1